MLLHRREDTEVALNAPVVVITDIILDHIEQFFFGGKAFAVITFLFQDAPEALHRAVIYALGHAGHTLRHSSFLQFVMEGTVSVLKSSVTVKERAGAGIGFHGSIKSLENQRIVIPVTYDIGNNTTVIEIKDRAEIDLVYLNAFVPFELCYIGQPFLVWLVRVEVSVKEILCYVLWIL